MQSKAACTPHPDDVALSDDERALRDFLLDTDCLDALSEWTSSFNLFDILGIARTEIRHSNVLAWLMDPNENHGLGDAVLRGFVQYAVIAGCFDGVGLDVLLADLHGCRVERECHGIDILVHSPSERVALCMENKIDSSEHDNQLLRYHKTLEEAFPDYRIAYLFLTPDGASSSDPDNWKAMSYQDVLDIVTSARERHKPLPEAELLISNYTDTLRRDIVGDERLAEICADIYSKHKRALDLIFENRPDRLTATSQIMREWAAARTTEGKILADLDHSSRTFTRFKTPMMSQIMPDASDALSGWGTSNFYFYEIHIDAGRETFVMKFSMSSKNIPDDLRATSNRINELHPAKRSKNPDWQWRVCYSTRKAELGEELDEERIFAQLDRMLAQVQKFEAGLKAELAETTR